MHMSLVEARKALEVARNVTIEATNSNDETVVLAKVVAATTVLVGVVAQMLDELEEREGV